MTNSKDNRVKPNQDVSKCCRAEVDVVGGNEGTMHYECSNCDKPCDVERINYSTITLTFISAIPTSAPQAKSWEKELADLMCDHDINYYEAVDFIHSLLHQQKEEMLEKINSGQVGVTKDTSGKMREYLFIDQMFNY